MNGDVGQRLNELLFQADQESLEPQQLQTLERYFELLIHWNSRTNLTAIRNPDDVLSRHFVESIVCARALPGGIASLLDFGSGAGFPGIPIAICRPEISVTLSESQNKKAAFLRECARTLKLTLTIHGGRAEALQRTFECVTMRAVDRMSTAIKAAAQLVAPGGWLVVMSTASELESVHIQVPEWIESREPLAMLNSEERVIFMGRRKWS